MKFDLVSTPEALGHLKLHNINRFVLSPSLWAEFTIPITLDWKVVKYDKREKGKLPQVAGVYTFIVRPGIANHPECSYLLYVGKTDRQTLRDRFLQYFSEAKKEKGREHIKLMLNTWESNLWYCFAEISNTTIIDDIENALLTAYVPPMNRDFKGKLGKALKAWS